MTITKTADVEGTLAADLRAGGGRGRHRPLHLQRDARRPRGWPRSCPAHRCRSSPTSTTSTAWPSPRSRPACSACGSTPATSASPSTSRLVAQECKDRGMPIRIGVNGGSLDPELYEKHGGRVTPEAMVESAQQELAYFDEVGFDDVKISVKASIGAADDRGVPAAGRGHRPPAAPRGHRGRSAARRAAEGDGRHRHAARRGHRRHDPLLPHRRSRRGGPRRPPAARGPRPPRAQERRSHRLPELRAGRDRRDRRGRRGPGRLRGAGDPAPGRGHGVRGQRPGRGARRRPRHRRRSSAGATSSSRAATWPSSPRTRWSPPWSSGRSSSTSTAWRRRWHASTPRRPAREAEKDRAALLEEQGDDVNASEQKVDLIHKRVEG